MLISRTGRVTRSDRRLTTTVDGKQHITHLATETEVRAAYDEDFEIRLERVPHLWETGWPGGDEFRAVRRSTQ
ncbi:hypothetical protein OHT93_00880 [Streptomyces sp. NBC_00191]|uniref:hypothetical protein n=1 Tax=Streptomyces sp. NBC_00191 TaxID=2975674 RepID=UPI00324D81A9